MQTEKVTQVDNAVLNFGKYRGLPVAEVPVDYLIWGLRKCKKLMRLVFPELDRRAAVMSGRDAMEAQVALGNYKTALGRSIGRNRRPTRSGKKTSRHGSMSDRHRQVSYRQEDKLAEGLTFVGEAYERLRQDFCDAGGDSSECPFDVGDYVYGGPRISWSGDSPSIVPAAE
jgi:hypothetical protein